MKMKAFLSILLSLLILVCATSKAWVYLAFKLNQSYIAAELCENRYETLVMCSGMCYLDKQLETLDQKEQKSNPIQQLGNKDFHFPMIALVDETMTNSSREQVLFSSPTWRPRPYNSGLLKPPQLSLFL